MSSRIRIINGKGDPTATPPTGADDHDLQSFANDFVIQAGVLDKDGGQLLVEELDTPTMKVKVAPGTVYVANAAWTSTSFEPRFYIVDHDAETEVDISSNASGQVRTDLICQQVDKITDPDDTASNVCPIVVVEGDPGAGAPDVPDDHELLATLDVPDGATAITSADITDSRREIQFRAGLASLIKSATTSIDVSAATAPTAGQVLTAVDEDTATWQTPSGGQTSSASAYLSADQPIPNGAETTVGFGAESWDTDAIHDVATNNGRLTIPAGQGGKWLLTTVIAIQASATNARQIKIRKNGTTQVAARSRTADGTFDTFIDLSIIVNASAGDYFEVLAFQNSGGVLNVKAGEGTSFFQCHRLS